MNELKSPYGDPQELEDICECVGKGWRPLIERLVTDLFAMGWDGEVHQVKEKFGGLRFYIGRGTPEMFARIYEAEDESLRVCEQCGAAGTTRHSSWIKVRCDRCQILFLEDEIETLTARCTRLEKETRKLHRDLRNR